MPQGYQNGPLPYPPSKSRDRPPAHDVHVAQVGACRALDALCSHMPVAALRKHLPHVYKSAHPLPTEV